MPKEYIDREKALEATTYNPLVEPDPTDIIYLTLMTAQKNIRKIPAADVAPVVHGEWEFISLDGSLWCSCCKQPSGYGRKAENKYCRNCGAKMDGGK